MTAGDRREDGAAAGPLAETDARIVKHAERLARARSSREGLRSALLEALDDEDDLPLGPLLREAQLFPSEPPPPEDEVFSEAQKIFDEQDAAKARGHLLERARQWWDGRSKPWVLGAAGLAAAAAALALVIFPRDPGIGPKPFAAAMAEVGTDSRKVVLAWALTLAADQAPDERGALLADATDLLRQTGARKGPAEPLSSELEQHLQTLREKASAGSWSASARAALEDLAPLDLHPEASRDAVQQLGMLLREAPASSGETVRKLADRWLEALEGSSRARLAYDVGRYLQRIGDSEAARAWYTRVRTLDPTHEVLRAAERRLDELSSGAAP